MRIFPFLIAMLILSGCAYTGEVVSIDTVVEEETDEPMPVAPAAAEEISEEISEPEPAEEEAEVESEEIAVETEKVYEGTVVGKTGPSSYRIRLANNKDIRILARDDLRPEMVIRFTLDKNNVVTSLVIVR